MSTQTPAPRTGRRRTTAFHVGTIAVVVFVGCVMIAPLLLSRDPLAQDVANRFLSPGQGGHLLGTDSFGRDVFIRLVYGLRTEIVVCAAGTVIAGLVGSAWGMVAGYYRGVADVSLMRLADIILAIPGIVLALLVVALYSAGSVTVIVVVAVVFAPQFARLAYGQVLSMRSLGYVNAARVFGARGRQVIFSVLLPNIAATLLAQFFVTLALAISLESGLSFLGMGIVPPTPSLGLMIAEARRFFQQNPGQLIIPCIVIVVLVLGMSYYGDLLRDRWDPRRAK